MRLISLLTLLLLINIIFSASGLGERCEFSRDCLEGYCIDGTCKLPEIIEKYDAVGECNSTQDCSNGFCYQNECIIPLREPSILPLGSGINNSCAGIIENCTGILCIFCNATWIILLLAAGFAAFLARNKGRLTPVLLFSIPILSALIFFPFIGAIIAILELILLAFVKPQLLRSSLEELKGLIKFKEEKKEEKEQTQ